MKSTTCPLTFFDISDRRSTFPGSGTARETDLEVLVGEVTLGGEAELVQEGLHGLGQDVLHRSLVVNILEEYCLEV